MEPGAGMPNFNQVPQQNGGNFEVGNNQLPQYNVDPSTTINNGEQLNQAPLQAEQLAIAEQLAQPSQVMPAATPNPTPVQPQSTTPVATPSVDADDIERAWVAKAQAVIAKDKDDPYELAHQIAMIMRDYLKTRYGKIVGKKDK